jgi:murein DD-endopeptidase MepM/ murein hydrolase activator NlpD
MYLLPPLVKMRLTQGFGVDLLGSSGPNGQSYADIGLKKGHNGWDLSCQTGTDVFAPMSGTVQCRDEEGNGKNVRIRNRDLGLEIILGHLDKFHAADGAEAVAGERVAKSDNTGFSTGPHLHFGVRKIHWLASGAGPIVDDYDNGFFGYVNPTPYFAPDVLDLPVDKQYGLTNQTPGVPSEISWQLTNVWVFRNLKRLLTTREMRALRYGFWDLRTVLDPAMFPVWTEMHKPEAIRRGIVK